MGGILMVDDDPKILQTLSQYFSSSGYNFICAFSAAEALQILENNKFDVIISDFKMPGADGMEFLKKVRKSDPLVGFVMLTAFPVVNLAVETMKLTADDYVEKPIVDLGLFAKKVAALLNKVLERKKAKDQECLLTGKPANLGVIQDHWNNINPYNFSGFFKHSGKNYVTILNEFVRQKIAPWPEFDFLMLLVKKGHTLISGYSWPAAGTLGRRCRRKNDLELISTYKDDGVGLMVVDYSENFGKYPGNKRQKGRVIFLPFKICGERGYLFFQCAEQISVQIQVFNFLTEIISFTQWMTITKGQSKEDEGPLRDFLGDHFKKKSDASKGFMDFIGVSGPMQEIYNSAAKIGPTNATVMITGETGTGKELAASTIHKLSLRKDKPFVPINCASLSESLLESELFGHEKGAFTGADKLKIGLFESANGGTIFFDEIGEITHPIQVKLLRVLQENEIRRIGNNRPMKINVRILASTNRNLMDEVYHKNFREDLYYRLNVVKIHLPPLRDRGEDIRVLMEHFLWAFAKKHYKQPLTLAPAAWQDAVRYPWPGNVRELINIVERAVIMSDGSPLDQLPVIIPLDDVKLKARLSMKSKSLKEAKQYWIDQFEREFISEKIKHNRGNVSATAKEIGVDVKTVWRKIRLLGIPL